MAGARVAMMTSALLKYGIPHLKPCAPDAWPGWRRTEYESIEQMQGT